MTSDSQSVASVTTTTTTIAAIFAILVAFFVPAGHFAVSYQFMMGTLDAQAELNSRAASALIVSNPNTWQFEQVRLAELLERRPLGDIPEIRKIVDLSGNIVAESADALRLPLITRKKNIYDSGRVVAVIEISRSIFPLLGKTLVMGMISCGISIFLFIALRNIPLRAIRKAYSSLEESEERYRTLYESMSEGVLICSLQPDKQSFTVLDLNLSAERILRTVRQKALNADCWDLFGRQIAEWLPEIAKALSQSGTLTFDYQLQEISSLIRFTVFSQSSDQFAALIQDITEKRRSEEQIKKLAYYDVLTGLPNRQLMHDRLDQALARAARDNGKVAVMFLDLDRFKVVNDTLGHAYGDLLLVQASLRLRDGLRVSDTVARLGGDEFVILLSYVGEELDAAHVAQHLLDVTSVPYDLGNRMVNTSATIGIAIFPDDALNAQTLLSSADMAMYAAKEAGRNCYNFFSQEMNQKAHERMELESFLRGAVERGEFLLEFQPIVDAMEGSIVAAEALVRWNHPGRGRCMPDSFIKVAEETNIIIPLGEWVLRTVCRKVKEWGDSGIKPLRISVNVSGIQFRQQQFLDTVSAIIAETGVNPRYLELELTETVLMENADATVKTLFSLKELGISIAVDDFGAGYSSLSYLKNFPIDRVKIDRSFIKDVCERPDNMAIVEAMIALAMSLKLFIVAEGVEQAEQLAFLASRNCDEIQGFYFHEPLPEDKLLELLKRS